MFTLKIHTVDQTQTQQQPSSSSKSKKKALQPNRNKRRSASLPQLTFSHFFIFNLFSNKPCYDFMERGHTYYKLIFSLIKDFFNP